MASEKNLDCCFKTIKAIVYDDNGIAFRDENGKCQRAEICFEKVCDKIKWHIQGFDVKLKREQGTSGEFQPTRIYLGADCCDIEALLRDCRELQHKSRTFPPVELRIDGELELKTQLNATYDAVIAYGYPVDTFGPGAVAESLGKGPLTEYRYPAEAIIRWPGLCDVPLKDTYLGQPITYPQPFGGTENPNLRLLTCILNKGTLKDAPVQKFGLFLYQDLATQSILLGNNVSFNQQDANNKQISLVSTPGTNISIPENGVYLIKWVISTQPTSAFIGPVSLIDAGGQPLDLFGADTQVSLGISVNGNPPQREFKNGNFNTGILVRTGDTGTACSQIVGEDQLFLSAGDVISLRVVDFDTTIIGGGKVGAALFVKELKGNNGANIPGQFVPDPHPLPAVNGIPQEEADTIRFNAIAGDWIACSFPNNADRECCPDQDPCIH